MKDINILNMMILTAALKRANRLRHDRFSRQYIDLLYCFYLVTKDQPRPLYYVPARFTNVLYSATHKQLKARTEKLIELGYLDRIETGKSRPQYVYQITIAGVNRLKELEDAAAYLVKLAKKRMKK